MTGIETYLLPKSADRRLYTILLFILIMQRYFLFRFAFMMRPYILAMPVFSWLSEKRKDVDGHFFDEAEQEADNNWNPELLEDITVPAHKQKAKRTHAEVFKNIPSCDEIITLLEERNCPSCDTQMEFIGKEFVRHEFRFTPTRGKVVNIYRKTYKFPECSVSKENPDEQTFVKAPVAEALIPGNYKG